MITPLTIQCSFHIDRAGHGARKELQPGPAPARPATAGRVPRVARLMALALRFEGLIRQGAVKDYAELARLGHVTRARVSQVMNLLNLAPDIQEALLFLSLTQRGRDPVILADLQPIACTPDWRKQRRLWRSLYAHSAVLADPT
jgi:hypothetical protein